MSLIDISSKYYCIVIVTLFYVNLHILLDRFAGDLIVCLYIGPSLIWPLIDQYNLSLIQFTVITCLALYMYRPLCLVRP